MVASHTETPLGVSKWLVRDYPPYNIACPWVGDMVSSCPLHISKVFCVMSLSPAISKHPRAFLYGWLPLSDAKRHHLLLDITNVWFHIGGFGNCVERME